MELTGQYNTTPPTLDNGDFSAIQIDGSGNLKVAGSVTVTGGGDASAAKQDQQTAILTTIDADTGNITTSVSSLDAKFPGSFSWFQNLAADVTKNIKASAGTVFSFYVFNTTGSTVYFQLWNSATTAAAGSLIDVWLVPAGSQVQIDEDYFSREGRAFSTGIAFGISSTLSTYTGASAQVVSVRYK